MSAVPASVPPDPSPQPGVPGLPDLAPRSWRAALGSHLHLLRADRTTWFAASTAAIVLTVSRYHASTGEYQSTMAGRYASRGGLFAAAAWSLHLPGLARWITRATFPTVDFLYWFLASFLLFGIVPFITAALLPGIHVRDLGVGPGDWRYGLKASVVLYGLMLPVLVVASRMSAFAGEYPMSGGAAMTWSTLIVFEVCYVLYFVAWELVFRGMLCVALYPSIGAAAILLQAIPFAVLHEGKPELEAYGAIVAAVILGAVAVRARSIWYGVTVHASVALTMDALALARVHHWPQRF